MERVRVFRPDSKTCQHLVKHVSHLLIDRPVCLLTLKHLVSLQARVRPSVQTELDLHTADMGKSCQQQ
jgi:hypothetical protein